MTAAPGEAITKMRFLLWLAAFSIGVFVCVTPVWFIGIIAVNYSFSILPQSERSRQFLSRRLSLRDIPLLLVITVLVAGLICALVRWVPPIPFDLLPNHPAYVFAYWILIVLLTYRRYKSSPREV